MKLTITAEQRDGKTMIDLSSDGLSHAEIIKILLQAVNKVVRMMLITSEPNPDPFKPTMKDFIDFLKKNFYAEETPQRKSLKSKLYAALMLDADSIMTRYLEDIRTRDMQKIPGIGEESCILFEEIRDYYFKTLKERNNENTIKGGS